MTAAPSSLTAVLEHVRTLARTDPEEDTADPQLLDRFVRDRDDAAFGSIVRRYGPLVLGVCRRVLQDQHDAEDAFQAVFLVLARKAGAIRRHTSLASWLYGVAHRVALKARTAIARRRTWERAAVERRSMDPAAELSWREVREAIDEELAILPNRLQAPLLLCGFEGLSRDEAARKLGWSAGAVKGRLERGRELLRSRLARRGVALSAGLGALLIAHGSANATLPPSLVTSVLQSAALIAAGDTATGFVSSQATALAESVLGSMTKAPARIVPVLLLAVGVLTVGVGLFLTPAVPGPRQVQGAPPPMPVAEQPKPQPAVLTDALGDPLPQGAFARIGTGRFRHEAMIYSIACSPDGKLIASTGCGSRAIHLWDAATGKDLHTFTQRGDPLAVAFAPDSKTFVTSGTPSLRLWDVKTGQQLQQFDGHTNGVTAVAFSPDGRTIASGSDDKTIRLWDPATGKEIAQLLGHTKTVSSVAFLGGQMLASGSQDKTLRFWDLTAHKELAKLEGHKGTVAKLAVSPDGSLLASTSDGNIHIWDVTTRQPLRVIAAHKERQVAVAFSPDGKQLVSGGSDKVVRFWDPTTGKQLRQIEGFDWQVLAVAFTPDGKELITGAIGDSTLRFWDPTTGKETRPHSGHRGLIGSLTFLGKGQELLSSSRDGTIRLWDAAEGKEKLRLEGGDRTAVSADGEVLAAAMFFSHSVSVFDLSTGKRTAQIEDFGERVGALALSPDGKRVVLGKTDAVVVWEPAAGKELRPLIQTQGAPEVLSFSPDGKIIAGSTAGQGQQADHPVYLWDAATGKELRHLTAHSQFVSDIAFSPDGKLIATGSMDHTAYLWDATTGQPLRQLLDGKRWIDGVRFSADGRYLAIGNADGTIWVWEVASQGEIAKFEGGQGETIALAFSPDGASLASGGSDCTILLWDLTGLRTKDGLPRRELTAKELEACGQALQGTDAVAAHRAMWKLTTAARQAVPFLKERLRPLAVPEPGRVDKLLEDLNSEDFKVRTAAVKELQAMAEFAEPALRKMLAKPPSVEAQRQAEQLLERLEGPLPSSERLAWSRSLQVLERIGNPEARQVLEGVAAGTPEAWLTKQARASLERIGQR